MKVIALLFLIITVQVSAQDTADIRVSYGFDLPGYKFHYRRYMKKPEKDSTVMPASIWRWINRQVDSLSNGLLRGKAQFEYVYINKTGEPLFETNNMAINDSGNVMHVKYRVVEQLRLNDSTSIRFAFDTDEHGNIMYKNELPLAFEKKWPSVIGYETAYAKARTVKEVKSYRQSYLYYDPILAKIVWMFHGAIEQDDFYAVQIDAANAEILAVEKVKLKPVVLEESRIENP